MKMSSIFRYVALAFFAAGCYVGLYNDPGATLVLWLFLSAFIVFLASIMIWNDGK